MRLVFAASLALCSITSAVHAAAPVITSSQIATMVDPSTPELSLLDLVNLFSECPERPSANLFQPEIPLYQPAPGVINIRPQDFIVPAPDPNKGFLFGGDIHLARADDPHHLFRMDPDRTVVATTTNHDFFLEDAFANPGADAMGGTADTRITVSPDGNNKVYLIDGNLWIDNPSNLSFILGSQTVSGTTNDGTHITFAVQGNIYVSDNFLYENLEKDAVAFIALKRGEDYPDELAGNLATEFGASPKAPASEGSGNIQFGDPALGTTLRFAGLVFAENDVIASNVNTQLVVYGNMTAGASCSAPMGKLVVEDDVRMERQGVTLPGIVAR